ncbi:MAG: hypothetical protein V2I43_29455 [Parvularcula sp.]|jgi:hypothetical protein|nr:hypothetical protein [Parvularcula sp.]
MRRSFCIALAIAMMVQSASAQDPFDLLFEDEQRLDLSDPSAPGQDDLLLVSLRLDRITFSDDLPAFRTDTGLCIDAEGLVRAIGAPIEVSDTSLDGWYLDPARTLSIEIGKDEWVLAGRARALGPATVRKAETGLCLDLALAGEVFAADFTFSSGDLAVEIAPHETWPIEAKLAREKEREKLKVAAAAQPDFALIDNPTRWLSWPTVDLNLQASMSRQNPRPLDIGAVLVGDFAHMTGRLQTVRDVNGEASLRASLAATDLPFRFEAGDLALPPSALIGIAEVGRGVRAGSFDASGATDILGSQQIRGPLPDGWEAELHDEQGLKAFVTTPDENGDYVFDAVALRPGYNRLTVRLFGPHGESYERPVRIFLGKELNPENTVRWDVAVVEKGMSLAGDGAPADRALLARGGVTYGLHDKATVGIEATASPDGKLTAASTLAFAAAGTITRARLAWKDDGGKAFEAGLQGRLGGSHTVALRFLDGGSLENDVLGQGADHIDSLMGFRLEGPTQLAGFRIPLIAAGGREERAGGFTQSHLSLSASGRVGRTTLRKSLRFEQTEVGNGQPTETILGDVLFGGRVFGQRLRAQLGYRCVEVCVLGNVGSSFQAQLQSDIHVGSSAAYDFDAGAVGFRLNAAKDFGQASAGLNLGLDPQRGWAAGFNLRFAVFREPGAGFRLGPPGMSQTGTLLPRVYEDIDEDDRFGPSDLPLAEASFIVGGTLRSSLTDGSGIASIDKVTTRSRTTVEVKRSSLPDPFLKPTVSGRTVQLRPGQVMRMDVPVRQTGEAELSVVLQKGDLRLPISGLKVEAFLPDGTQVGEARTSYDGSVYLTDLPLRELTIRVAEEELARFGATANPVTATLSRTNPYASGLSLVIASNPTPPVAGTGY